MTSKASYVPAPRWFTVVHPRLWGGEHPCLGGDRRVSGCASQRYLVVAMWSEGNSVAYIEDLKKRKGPDADQPHRIKYKKLVRS